MSKTWRCYYPEWSSKETETLIYRFKKSLLKNEKTTPIIEQFGEIVSISGIATSDLSKNTKNDIMNTVIYIEKIDR